MKSPLLLLFLLPFCSLLPAQEPVARITQVAQSQSWYKDQARLWKAHLDKQPTDADAWLQYYFAARYANATRPSGFPAEYDLDEVVLESNRRLPGSYAAEYLQYMQKLGTMEAFPHLLNAMAQKPDWTDLYHDMIGYYMLTGDEKNARAYSVKWFDSGECSPGLLAWNYNMLQSVEENAILMTWGDNDTYYAWMLQLGRDLRPDVLVLNLNLLTGYNDYRGRIFTENNIPEPDWNSPEAKKDYRSFILGHLRNHTSRPLYIGCGMPQELYADFGSNLYTTGLAFKYSQVSFDNLAVLRRNYEQLFLKDNLLVSLEKDNSAGIVATMNANYLPAFLRLFQHYQASGETLQAEKLRAQILAIAKKADMEDDVNAYLGEQVHANIVSGILVRDLDKGMKKVGDKLYAEESELSNRKYEQFLMDLLRNKEYDKIDLCKVGSTNWRSILPDSVQVWPDEKVFLHGHPDGPEMPVENISFEAARLYCAWITDVYNNSTDKKKAFKKVRFRLPSEEEWKMAARGSVIGTDYSWGGPFVRNSKGCYLGNFNTANMNPKTACENAAEFAAQDGGFFPVAVTSYFPNSAGLYCVHGNVAEMISVKGEAMGGSWADTPDKCTLSSKQTYTAPGPSIGFRVFMEVIEE